MTCPHGVPDPATCPLCSAPSQRRLTNRAKPRMSLEQIVAARKRCMERRARGLACNDLQEPAPAPEYVPLPVAPLRRSALPSAPPDPIRGSKKREDGQPLEWAYGVTCVPERLRSHLPQTLESLKAAGFPRPRLFLDGGSVYDVAEMQCSKTHSLDSILPITLRSPRILAYGNWLLGLLELYTRQPGADRYAMFQDDILLVKNLRAYLDQCEYPDPLPTSPQETTGGMFRPQREPGYWNLFTAPSNLVKCPDNGLFTGWYGSNQCGKGALALVFSHAAVQTLLGGRGAMHLTRRLYNPGDPRRQSRSIDGGVVTAMQLSGWYEYVHSPSLVQHTGEQSVIGTGKHPPAPNFPGTDFDALSLVKVGAPGTV